MNTTCVLLHRFGNDGPARRARRRLRVCVLLLGGAFAALPVQAATTTTTLADQPIFDTTQVPGNVALALSVEMPTAISVANAGATYSSANEYLGYFDANKCYTYLHVATDPPTAPAATPATYFIPSSSATGHKCTSKWSGNYLNWATAPAIDSFRWVMTGGYRVIDTSSPPLTVLEKAWSSTQCNGLVGGCFPEKCVDGGAEISGATPFAATATALQSSVWSLGNRFRFKAFNSGTCQSANYTVQANMLWNFSPTSYNPSNALAFSTVYAAFTRVKVCDSAIGLESNCVPYGAYYKPEGLMQQYSSRIRFSVHSYLNDSNQQRDGGVLRAQMKFVGPTQPVPNSTPIANPRKEWDGSTGVYVTNPDSADVTSANSLGLPAGTITNSGAINYVNKFGQIGHSYKVFDNVGELYYATLRYYKKLADVPEWTSTTGASNATIIGWADSFPVIKSPSDPILYACQKNFILGIGDVNSNADKNVPGGDGGPRLDEPAMPATVAADTTIGVGGAFADAHTGAVRATNKVAALDGSSATTLWGNGKCQNNAGYACSAYIAGMAYDAHTVDIRPDDAAKAWTIGKQTIDTYWVDVLERQDYLPYNQYYLAAKYGGFTVPSGYQPYSADNTALSLASWSTTSDTNTGFDRATSQTVTQSRPDNYFTGGSPATMKSGLEAAFTKIIASINGFTTAFSTTIPQLAQTNNASFSSNYDAASWTGEVTAKTLSFDATTGDPISAKVWDFTAKLATQLSGTGWDSNRRVVTWDGSAGVAFRASGSSKLDSTAQGLLDTSYVSGNDSVNYVNYLRGDTSNETDSTANGSARAYRARAKLLGDIVGSKLAVVGPPSFPFSDTTNKDYSTFKTTWANRPTVVYVGANDGMLHAINGALTGTGAGSEMFAYVPRALLQGPTAPNTDGLASLGNPSFTHHYMVNATPRVYDIDFGNTDGNRSSGVPGTPDWHSVLIGGLGKGGRSYYAIDVTDPAAMAASETVAASKVLWEFSDDAMGYTFGEPVVVKTKKYGWVVIFPSGYDIVGGTTCDGKVCDGYDWFLVVDPRTGGRLERIPAGAVSASGMAHINAFVVDATDGTADAVYGGDTIGNLWRADVTAATGGYPAATRVARTTDPSGGLQPITSRPSIEIHPTTRTRFVMVGTGTLLDKTNIASSQIQSFYAIADGSNAKFNAAADLPSGLTFPLRRTAMADASGGAVTFNPSTQVGWYIDLGVDTTSGLAWRVTTDPTTLAGSVAFAATLPNGDVCNPSGSSRVYARDFATAVSTSVDVGNNPVSYVGLTGAVTDLHYLSIGGTAALLAGTDVGIVSQIRITPPGTFQLRRLNWRELQIVD